MKRYNLNLPSLTVITAIALGSVCYGDQVQWFNTAMEDEWWDAVGDVTTIDFTDYPHATPISDQYADLGVNFEGFNFIFETPFFVNDGFGLYGFGGTWVHFDEPMNWIAADFPGVLSFALYSEDELIYESFNFGKGPTGNFAGLVSDKPFDNVYLFKPEPFENLVFIDDLHFGALTVPAPPALGLVALALIANRRRRRE